MEVAVALTPHSALARPSLILGSPVAADSLERCLEDVQGRPPSADLPPSDIPAASFNVAEQAVIAVAVVLRSVAEQADSIADLEHALDRSGGPRAAALLAEVDLGRVDADQPDALGSPSYPNLDRVAVRDRGYDRSALASDGRSSPARYFASIRTRTRQVLACPTVAVTIELVRIGGAALFEERLCLRLCREVSAVAVSPGG